MKVIRKSVNNGFKFLLQDTGITYQVIVTKIDENGNAIPNSIETYEVFRYDVAVDIFDAITKE